MFIWASTTIISSSQALLLSTGGHRRCGAFHPDNGESALTEAGHIYHTTAASSVGEEVHCRCGQDGWFVFTHLLLSYSCSPMLACQ